ncbi:UNVERIFIED_CONTAM: Dolichyl-diphosphooligosaccharide--protein glycosyltransferase subunit DAD1 [Sesamum latifolium]|uniref:Dolichyl-diphosphooligosaccharide--protein glycosyltransferase subunit DAD1 n=1 Tax=Sesamum latifolium TaxID=2727402 RepID=A0AAW2WX48_9LAMI
MGRSATTKDAQDLFHSLRSAYAATPNNLKIIDLYIVFAVVTAVIQVVYMAIVGSFPFNSFLSGVLSCVGTAVLAVSLRIQVNKEIQGNASQSKFSVPLIDQYRASLV